MIKHSLTLAVEVDTGLCWECVYVENYALQKLTGVLLPDRVIIYTFLEEGEMLHGS